MKSTMMVAAVGLLWVTVSFFPANAAQQVVGKVELVKADAYGTPPGGEKEARFPRYDVVFGETLETVREGAMHVNFLDGSILQLGASSVLAIEDYIYDPAGGKRSQVINMAEGVFRFASGEMPNEAVVLKTPTMVLGIRGTVIDITVAKDGATTVHVLRGNVLVTAIISGLSRTVGAGNGVAVGADGKSINPVQDSRPATDPGLLEVAGGDSDQGTAGKAKPPGSDPQKSLEALRRMRQRYQTLYPSSSRKTPDFQPSEDGVRERARQEMEERLRDAELTRPRPTVGVNPCAGRAASVPAPQPCSRVIEHADQPAPVEVNPCASVTTPAPQPCQPMMERIDPPTFVAPSPR